MSIRLILVAALFMGAKAPDAACWITSDMVLHATGLPTRDEIAITTNPYPVGTTIQTDGTLELQLWQTPPVTIYIWQRGGGKSLFKAGPQLNDYHVIAMCSA